MELYEAIKTRRSRYYLNKDIKLTDDRIIEIVNEAIKYAPSAFNSQSSRVLVLLNKEHDKLWDITLEALRKVVSSKQFPVTETKIKSFKAAYGTILFFEDQNIVDNLQKEFPTYRDNFPLWSYQSSGMLQYIVWTSLASEGIGASLQHYNPLIDSEVKDKWHIPDNWRLISQMPFGNSYMEPDQKTFKQIEERLKIAR